MRWWKHLLLWNLALIGLYGVLAIGGLLYLRNGDSSLTGVNFETGWTSFWPDCLLIVAIGFGLPNLFLILRMAVFNRPIR